MPCRKAPPRALGRLRCRHRAASKQIEIMPSAPDLWLCRSLLFLPASNPRAIEKARGLAADIVVLDLEDAVKAEDEESARASAVEAVRQPFPGLTAIRINSKPPWHEADLAAV